MNVKFAWHLAAIGLMALSMTGVPGSVDAQTAAAGSQPGSASSPAQGYPNRPIRLIVPSAPGGGLDFMGRMIGVKLSESTGQTVVVDNRGGGTGSIALEITARAAPDGYTLFLLSTSQVVFSAANKTRFDLFNDFVPISHIAGAPYVLVVNPQLAVNSVGDLIAMAKASPARLNYASSGPTSLAHMATELFGITTGTKLVHVPFKSLGAALPDLLSGQVQMSLGGAFTFAGHIRAKRLRALAIARAGRSSSMPELPTMIESGVPGFVVTQWYGLLVPSGAPRAVVDRLHREVVALLKKSDVQARLEADGTEPVGSTPAQLASYIKSEYETWLKVAKHMGLRSQ
jgi:tripartite-type tricarboxylate transporter receptor subunit TctC